MSQLPSSPDPEKSLVHHLHEPIRFPGSIQPHGVLLAFTIADLEIQQVSRNTHEHLHIQPDSLLYQSLGTVFNSTQIDHIRRRLAGPAGQGDPLQFSIPIPVQPAPVRSETGPAQTQQFEGLLHRVGELAILELEPEFSPEFGNIGSRGLDMQQGDSAGLFHGYAQVRRAIAQLQQPQKLHDFLHQAADSIQQITGFAQVLIYQFDGQGSGEVVAEAKQTEMTSYLGLHYPALDIPQTARELYVRQWLRFIPDLQAQPVELLTAPELDTPSLDLGPVMLRSVHPCCVEYHQNMGVAALLVIPLVQKQNLWGLISCHHPRPRYLNHETRSACGLLGQVMATELANQISHQDWDYRLKLNTLQSEVMASIAQADNLVDALVKPESRLLALVGAQGAAVCLGNDLTLIGETPNREEIQALLVWTDTNVMESLFHTPALPNCYPPAQEFQGIASGLLMLRISQVQRYSILWFRPEVVRTVNWAGDPNQPVQFRSDGVSLSPRASFERWQETVAGTSLPWQPCEVQGAVDLRTAIVGIVLKQADELARINLELERSNQELDSFTYAASHDLKEPLRGIHNYSTFLREDYAEILDEAGIERLETLIQLTQRMENLIDVMLKFSRLGQGEIHLRTADLNGILQLVIQTLKTSRQGFPFHVRVPRQLPETHCDPSLIGEVFSNLLSNAFKYNQQAEPWAEVGFLTSEEKRTATILPSDTQGFGEDPSNPTPIFYVRDNGIGIRDRHQSLIFRLFKRLHSPKKYGGGTGAGLTIVKKIVERHGGRIWVESTYGVGTTFYFTLA